MRGIVDLIADGTIRPETVLALVNALYLKASWLETFDDAATKRYVGGLNAQFILPDERRFDEIATNLATVLTEYELNRTSGAELGVPRFEMRTSSELSEALNALGLTAPYRTGGHLGIADDPRLIIDQVIHEAFVAMDADGTEAAATTVVLAYPTSGPALPPVPVVLDRPFLYRIVDDTSGATLFIGQITNPTTERRDWQGLRCCAPRRMWRWQRATTT